MKIRSGFVSNSSSSSFIVAANKENTNIKITLETDLKKYGKVLTTEQEVKDYFIYEYGDDYDNVAYNSCLSAIKEGKIIIIGSFDSDTDDNLEKYLCNKGIPKNITNIKIIQNEGGY